MKLLQNEEHIIRAALDGDEGAFKELFLAYQKPVYNFVYRMLGNVHDAADVTQEVFIKMYRHFSTLKKPAYFSTWLFSIAKNEAISALRRQSKRQQQLDRSDIHQKADHVRAPGDPDQQILSSEFETLFQKILSEIPEIYRVAFILGVLEEQPYEDVAKILKCTVGNIKSRVFRARMMLCKKMKKLKVI